MKHFTFVTALVLAASTFAYADTPKNAKLSESDRSVVSELHHANQTEVDLGKYALSHGTKTVKSYATMMVKDHSANDTKLVAMAKKHGIMTIPAPPINQDEIASMRKLEDLTGTNFDRAYIDAMVQDHEQDIKMVSDAIATVSDADLKAHLTATKPVLEHHLDSAKALQRNETQARR